MEESFRAVGVVSSGRIPAVCSQWVGGGSDSASIHRLRSEAGRGTPPLGLAVTCGGTRADGGTGSFFKADGWKRKTSEGDTTGPGAAEGGSKAGRRIKDSIEEQV